jgi:uncharacterized low-complexity protein
MRLLIAAAVAGALVAGFAQPADAVARAKSYKSQGKKQIVRSYRRSSAKPTAGDAYVEHDVDRLPFGTATWWEQMAREGRLGDGGGGY